MSETSDKIHVPWITGLPWHTVGVIWMREFMREHYAT